jgi:hypothetical protein
MTRGQQLQNGMAPNEAGTARNQNFAQDKIPSVLSRLDSPVWLIDAEPRIGDILNTLTREGELRME